MFIWKHTYTYSLRSPRDISNYPVFQKTWFTFVFHDGSFSTYINGVSFSVWAVLEKGSLSYHSWVLKNIMEQSSQLLLRYACPRGPTVIWSMSVANLWRISMFNRLRHCFIRDFPHNEALGTESMLRGQCAANWMDFVHQQRLDFPTIFFAAGFAHHHSASSTGSSYHQPSQSITDHEQEWLTSNKHHWPSPIIHQHWLAMIYLSFHYFTIIYYQLTTIIKDC